MGDKVASEMENHYKTFIVCLSPLSRTVVLTSLQTEQDFAEIAAAGLNWVRVCQLGTFRLCLKAPKPGSDPYRILGYRWGSLLAFFVALSQV